MPLRTALLLLISMVSPCLAQSPAHMQEIKLSGGLSCQVPMDWIVDSSPSNAASVADTARPRVLLQARAMMPPVFARTSHGMTLAISTWPSSSPATAANPAQNPSDTAETLSVRQGLALEGFSITKAWTAASNTGGVQVVASTFLGAIGRESPWVVETTTWQDDAAIYAAQLRYPEQMSPETRAALLAIKNGIHFKDQPGPAFASGYVMPDGLPGFANRTPAEAMARAMQNVPPAIPAPNGSPSSLTVPVVPQADAAEAVRRAGGSLVLVEGKEKSGSGFVCNLGGQKFLVTNTHVVSGNTDIKLKPIDRAPIQVSAASAAVGHDLTRMAVTSANPALDLLDNLYANLSVGDAVLVLGNAEGAQVINPIAGRVVGIGPDLVEVDAPFVSGNSGSPIIQVRTGKVIGVATYIITRELETLADGTKEKKVRRFGYRIDSVATWQPINWARFSAEAAALQRVEELTLDLAGLWKSILKDGSVRAGVQQNAALRRAADDYVQIAESGSRPSSADMLKAKQSFLSTVQTLCTSDLATLRPTLTYDYYQREAADEQEIRSQFSKGYAQLFSMQSEETSSQRRSNQH